MESKQKPPCVCFAKPRHFYRRTTMKLRSFVNSKKTDSKIAYHILNSIFLRKLQLKIPRGKTQAVARSLARMRNADLVLRFFRNVDFFYHETASQALRADVDSARAAVAKVRLDFVKVRKPHMLCMMVRFAHSVSVLRAFAANIASSHSILPAFNSI